MHVLKEATLYALGARKRQELADGCRLLQSYAHLLEAIADHIEGLIAAARDGSEEEAVAMVRELLQAVKECHCDTERLVRQLAGATC